MSPGFENIFKRTPESDEKSFIFLIKALERSNQPGFDYLEFKQSVSTLVSMNIDFETAVKSAFTTAATVGLTRDKLLDTAATYQKVLLQEKAQFDQALSKQITDRIETRKSEAQKLQAKILSHEEQIKKLQAEILQFKEKVDNTDKDIADAESRIKSSQEKFEQTFNEIMKQIDEDMSYVRSNL